MLPTAVRAWRCRDEQHLDGQTRGHHEVAGLCDRKGWHPAEEATGPASGRVPRPSSARVVLRGSRRAARTKQGGGTVAGQHPPARPARQGQAARLKSISHGVTRHGEDVGRWLATQRRD